MQTPEYSRVARGGRVCGNRRDCTCLAISSSWAARRSASCFAAIVRRFFSEEHAASAASAGFSVLTRHCRFGSLRGLRLIADALESRRCLEADAALGPFLEFG